MTFWEDDILRVDISGVDILRVDILGGTRGYIWLKTACTTYIISGNTDSTKSIGLLDHDTKILLPLQPQVYAPLVLLPV